MNAKVNFKLCRWLHTPVFWNNENGNSRNGNESIYESCIETPPLTLRPPRAAGGAGRSSLRMRELLPAPTSIPG